MSLNTPAVRLVDELTPERVIDLFASLRLTMPMDDSKGDLMKKHGLSIALGTMGHSLLDLAQGYAVIPNGGLFTPATFSTTSPASSVQPERIFTPDACAMVTKILSMRRLAGDVSIGIAWKTGTSNGNHDAWCFGYTADYTLGVWFGNKNGRPAAALVGASAAAPALVDIFNAIYRNSAPSPWPDSSALLPLRQLCAKSGLAATPSCLKQFTGTTLQSVPLRLCDQCGVFAKKPPITILSPQPEHYVADGDGTAKLRLRASISPVLWYVDNDFIGENSPFDKRSFAPGRHVIRAVDPNDMASPSSVTFVVTK